MSKPTAVIYRQAADAFHEHLDACERCANQPFNLCTTGALLIQNVGARLNILHGPRDNGTEQPGKA